MKRTVGKLRKLGLHEMRARTAQRVHRLGECLGLIRISSLETAGPAGFSDKSEVGRYIRNFLPAIQKFPVTGQDGSANRLPFADLENRFASYSKAVRRLADEAISSRFQILGYNTLINGDPLPDWHFDPIAGKRAPRVHWSRIDELSFEQTGDKKVIWELNRHQYFVTLGQAFWLTGDERYAEAFVRHIEDWFEQNPPKIGVNWLSSLELAYRSISWIWAWGFFEDSPKFGEGTRRRMLEFLYVQARHIETYLSTYFSPNTHLTGEALGLYMIGTFLSGLREAKRWRLKGYRIMMEALDYQVRADGSYCEQSSHYTRYTADLYLTLLIMRLREGLLIEQKHLDKLNSLLGFMMHITGPDGRTPLFGDEDGGRLYQFDDRPVEDMRSPLALGSVLFGRPDLRYVGGDPAPELFWLLGPQSVRDHEKLASAAPEETSRAFGDGGFFTARSSWDRDADHIVIICGPHGFMNGGHAHADALSFVLAMGGRPLFVDSGTFVYTADLTARDLYRSTAAHNCLTVNGISSSLPAGPFSWKTMANARLIEWNDDGSVVRFRGEHDGFERIGVRYDRSILFDRGGLVILTDRVESREVKSFELNFILDPDIRPAIELNVVELAHTDEPGWKIRMTTECHGNETTGAGAWEIEDWTVSKVYGKATKTKKLVYKLSSADKLEIATSIERL